MDLYSIFNELSNNSVSKTETNPESLSLGFHMNLASDLIQYSFANINSSSNNFNNNFNKNSPKPVNVNKSVGDDDDLINFIFNDNSTTNTITPILNQDNLVQTNKTDLNTCPNPLCDHKGYTKQGKLLLANKKISPPVTVNSITDLIALGKTYHCKKNVEYYGVDLKIICKLVKPLTELNSLIGMHKVKESIINQIIFFLQKFNVKSKCNICIPCVYGKPCSNNSNQDMLHTVITGPPGVGKTELGKILGHIYKEMGVLSKGHMHIAKRPDLIGKFLGQTAPKTQEFIDKCTGGVMFIDEAYSLGNKEGRDSYSKACIDTLNQNLTEKKDFLCIVAGYKHELEQCFFAHNPGLNRRFPFRYNIDGYNSDELMQIFLLKVSQDGWTFETNVETNSVKRDKLITKLRTFFNSNLAYFPHYGGDIETLFLNCKIFHSKRCLFKDPSLKKILTMHDLIQGFNNFVQYRDINIKKEEEMTMSQRMMYM